VVFTKAREINLQPGTFQDNTVSGDARHYLNVLIKRYFKEKKYVEWGMNSKFYDPEALHEIPEYYLQIYTGFKTSCQIYQNHIPKILIDFSSRIVRSDSALFYIKECKNSAQVRDMLEGRTVIASYGNYRMWRITKVDFSRNPRTGSFTENGKKISVVDYFKTKYNITIKDMNQPLLVNVDRRTGKESLLVPELVQMTGLDDDMVRDYHLMNEVAKYTRLDPLSRYNKIKSLCSPLAEFYSKNYGITMEQQSSVTGHVLNPPKLKIGHKDLIPDNKGTYQMREPIFHPANFDKWVLFYAGQCEQDAKILVETLQKCASAYAIGVKKPIMVAIKDNNPEAFKKTVIANLKADTQIAVALYPPNNKKTWYKVFKDVCCKQQGIPCQAVVSATLKKNAMSVCSKILLQMNAKVGKELWVTEQPKDLPAKTMIIGADVYHSTKIGQEKKSCIGFCASLNPGASRFFSKVTLQKREGQEIMTNIGLLVKEAVLKYFASTGKKFFPENIIFYRDGVAENQLGLIMEFETKTIIDQLKTIEGYDFKFAEIIVTKRIDDRFFTNEGAQGGRPGGRGGSEPKNFANPPAGTVVAEKVVSDNFDFFLVSQNVNQGTCTPTHYNVIYDTTGLSQDVFWQLTYNQCYNYYNWNGGVRVPAPCQYAHKLAYLVGQTIQSDEIHTKLDQYLYYL